MTPFCSSQNLCKHLKSFLSVSISEPLTWRHPVWRAAGTVRPTGVCGSLPAWWLWWLLSPPRPYSSLRSAIKRYKRQQQHTRRAFFHPSADRSMCCTVSPSLSVRGFGTGICSFPGPHPLHNSTLSPTPTHTHTHTHAHTHTRALWAGTTSCGRGKVDRKWAGHALNYIKYWAMMAEMCVVVFSGGGSIDKRWQCNIKINTVIIELIRERENPWLALCEILRYSDYVMYSNHEDMIFKKQNSLVNSLTKDWTKDGLTLLEND